MAGLLMSALAAPPAHLVCPVHEDTLKWIGKLYPTKEMQEDCFRDMQVERGVFLDWARKLLSRECMNKLTRHIRDKIAASPKLAKAREEKAARERVLLPAQSRVGETRETLIVFDDCDGEEPARQEKRQKTSQKGPEDQQEVLSDRHAAQALLQTFAQEAQSDVAASRQSGDATSEVHPLGHGPKRQKPQKLGPSIHAATQRLSVPRPRAEILPD
jgi:hypothetical protein